MKPLIWSGILGAAAIVTALAFGADIIAAPRPIACNAHDIEHLSNEALRTRLAVQMLRDDMRKSMSMAPIRAMSMALELERLSWGATVTP